MTQLGRYEILQQLASGGVADVLLARASGLEGFTRHVVIKVIRPDLSADNRFAKAFLDEARIAGSLHHQNIVQVYDIDEQAGSYFFTMEYVHGEDLRKILLKARETGTMIPIDMAVAIAIGAAAGLHHAHEQHGPDRKPLGLVHRDVSPGNILIGYDGSVKLVDFGLAKAALRSAKTRTGSLRGKAPYMSPELCTGKPVDRRSDTFALGIVLYELVTGRRLFKSGNDFLTMAAIVEGSIEPPSVHRTDLPKRLDEIIMRALAKSPESRYQTADDLRNALESFSIEAELRTTGKAVSDYMKKLFGARAEPWHDVAPPALDGNIDFDERQGVVSAPEENASLIAKLGSGVTSPIALAQNLAQEKPDPGFEDDEEPTRHMPDPEPGAFDGPTVRSSGSPFPQARAGTSNDGPTRIDLPPAEEEQSTIRPGQLPSPNYPDNRDDEELPTLRGGMPPVRDRDRNRNPIDDELVTQRQPLAAAAAARRSASKTDEMTSVTPPLFPTPPTPRPAPIVRPTPVPQPAPRPAPHAAPKPVPSPAPMQPQQFAPEPTPPRLPAAPTPSYRWVVIAAAIVVPVIIAAIAIRSCGSTAPIAAPSGTHAPHRTTGSGAP